MSQHSTVSTSAVAEESSTSSKSGSSVMGSLKKLKNKDAEVPLTDDFVLMTAPDKFKDKNINETNAVKRHRSDFSPNEKINRDCLLLSDTSEQSGAPVHVTTLLNHFAGTQPTQAELLFLLVYSVALECGFLGLTDYELAKFNVDHLSATSSFHARNVLRLSRLVPSYTTAADKTRFSLKMHSLVNVERDYNDHLYALLTGLVTGDFLIITLSPANATGAQGFSISLSIGRYILSIQNKNKPIYERFRKLDEFSLILRDQLFGPMRCQHLRWLSCCIYPALDGLPVELYDHIAKYLNRNELEQLATVNKSLYNSIKISRFLQRPK